MNQRVLGLKALGSPSPHFSIENRVLQAIDAKVFPGCVVGVVRKGGERFILPFGNFTYEKNSRIVHENSIFDVASITKCIPTACLALRLIDEGRLSLEDCLIDYVPEFCNRDREHVLIKHLLTQTLNYDLRLSSFKDRSADQILEIVLTAEFKSKPGTKFSYSNITSVLLGLVVEKIFGEKLDKLGERYFFEPLRMQRTAFRPEEFSKDEIVPTEMDPWRGRIIQGEVHDESAYKLRSKFIVGSAGLFSTAPDLLNFLEMLLNDGSLNRHRFFSSAVIGQMHTNQLAGIGEFTGLGWELYQERFMGKYYASQVFGKTGFTGCSMVCDISKGVGIVILSNFTFPRRKPNADLMNEVRRDIADIVFQSFGKDHKNFDQRVMEH